MSMLDRLPFWQRYFAELGIETVLSPVTDPRISAAGIEMAVAQPCYPVQVAHGHVQALLEAGVDYVLVPNIADAESARAMPARRTTARGTRRCRGCCARRPALEPHQHKFLIPTLHFQLGPAQVKKALAETMRRLGVTRRASDRAVDAAYTAQREFQEKLLDAGRRALASAGTDRRAGPGAGRPRLQHLRPRRELRHPAQAAAPLRRQRDPAGFPGDRPRSR